MNFADIIIHNARIITMDDLQPFAEALAIRGNRIMRVGQNAAVMELCGSKTRVIDNHGNTVIPGIPVWKCPIITRTISMWPKLMKLWLGIHGGSQRQAERGLSRRHCGAGSRHGKDRIDSDLSGEASCYHL